MNILFIEQHPRFIGGSERMGLSICTYLHGRGHATRLLYETDGDMVGAYAAVTVATHRLAVRPVSARRPVEAVRSLVRLRRLVKVHGVDAVFTSQLGYVSLLGIARMLWGVPAVVHLGLFLPLDSPLFRWSLPRIAAGVAPSEEMRRDWTAAGWPPERLRVIPNGVDLARFRPRGERGPLRAGLGLPVGTDLVAYVGRLVPEKGILTLLHAAALLRRSGRLFHLVVVGPSPAGEREGLLRAADGLGLGPSIFSVHPPTSQPELYYAAADIVVVPSEWKEPFGLAAIESMACGALTIVSDAGILPEIVGGEGCGYVFPQGDAQSLADRMGPLLGDPSARTAVSEAGLARVRSRYGLALAGEAYENELARSAGKR